jgi:hypothetical protein
MVSKVTDPVYLKPRTPGFPWTIVGFVLYILGLIATYQAELNRDPAVHDWLKIVGGWLGIVIGGLLILWDLATLPLPMVAPRLRTPFVLVIMIFVTAFPAVLYLLLGPPLYFNRCVIPNEPIPCDDHHTFGWRFGGGLLASGFIVAMFYWAVERAFGKIVRRWMMIGLAIFALIIGQAVQSKPLPSYDDPHPRPSPTVTVSPR